MRVENNHFLCRFYLEYIGEHMRLFKSWGKNLFRMDRHTKSLLELNSKLKSTWDKNVMSFTNLPFLHLLFILLRLLFILLRLLFSLLLHLLKSASSTPLTPPPPAPSFPSPFLLFLPTKKLFG